MSRRRPDPRAIAIERDVATVAAHELHHDVQIARRLLERLPSELRQGAADEGETYRRLQQSLELLERNIDRLLVEGGASLDGLQRVPTDLGGLIHRVVDAHDPDRRSVTVDAASVALNVDAVKVERIVDNLVVNALDHTPAGCPVSVRLETEVGSGRPGVVLTVEDAGPGLPDHVRAALLSGASSSPRPAGMGLWIVVHFARLHGGDVELQPGADGSGLCFRVRLPAKAQNSAADSQVQAGGTSLAEPDAGGDPQPS